MVAVREIEAQLRRVWSQFRKAGIADDLQIIEHIAAILTKDFQFPEEQLRPQLPSIVAQHDLEKIQKDLEKIASHVDGGKTGLFDPYVLFQLDEDTGKGQFPIPRHIVEMMLTIAQIEPYHSVADFTCGSGGFFVYLNNKRRHTGALVGIELDPKWARIAQANILLHGLHLRIEQGDALRLAGVENPLALEKFDRVMMAPSFGMSMNNTLTREVFHGDVSTRSDIVLPLFALQKLRDDGRAVIIVSSDLLTRNNTDALQLRKELIAEYKLEAVISLSIDALQPFSALATSLVLVQNKKPAETSATWFCNIADDGYPSGKNRNVTMPPDPFKARPMQFISHLLLSDRIPFKEVYANTGSPCLNVKWVPQALVPLGVVIGSIGDLFIHAVNYHSIVREGQKNQFLLVQTSNMAQTDFHHIVIGLHDTANQTLDAWYIKDPEQWLRERYDLEDMDASIPSGKSIFVSAYLARAIAIDVNGRLSGVLVNQVTLNTAARELNPRKFLGLEGDSLQTTIDHPARLLGKVRIDQRRLYQRIESFMGRLDIPSMVGQQVPSKLCTRPSAQKQEILEEHPPRLLEMVGDNEFFSPEQQAVWEKVRQQVYVIHDYQTARYFTAEDVQAGGKANTLATLNLLVRMGLIVPVTVVDNSTSVARYRRITERDIWEP